MTSGRLTWPSEAAIPILAETLDEHIVMIHVLRSEGQDFVILGIVARPLQLITGKAGY